MECNDPGFYGSVGYCSSKDPLLSLSEIPRHPQPGSNKYIPI
jgi:hypothetical protein